MDVKVMGHKISDEQPTVPVQEKGTKKDIGHTVKAADENDAKKLFMIARNRLVNVNEWHEYSRPVTGVFKVVDASGNEVNRTVEKGDYFKIDLPAPGNNEGTGHDWVHVEAIDEKGDPNGSYESVVIRVRPSPNPTSEGNDTAHFFNEEATSSFVLERNGLEVTAAVFGRNEVPNTDASNLIDKVRNAVVGTTAILGFSNVQWKNLVKGLLETN
jgi:hypothetical protein